MPLKEKTKQQSEQKAEKKRLPLNTVIMFIIAFLMVILNIFSWISVKFSDFYTEYIFHALSSAISPITGAVPFSLGEVMICIGILLLFPVLPALLITAIVRRCRKLPCRKFMYITGTVYGWVLTFILVTETMNCFINYHTTEFSYKYHNGAGADGFTVAQLCDLCRETVIKANELAGQVSRDENGKIALPDDVYSLSREAMSGLGNEYSMLRGNYPDPKIINASMLMTQFDLQGVYFPFSLEANYNRELCPARVPATVCHELSHLKGFIREDEACFVAYRACIGSDNAELQYSGYISALNYLCNAVKKNASPDEANEIFSMISDNVRADNKFVSDEFVREIKEKAVIPTETASAVSEKAMDTTLKINGITDGKRSYSRMVDLLLEYHYMAEQ